MKMPRPLGVLAAAVLSVLAFAAADLLVVKIQTTVLRRNPQYFAPTVLALNAGDRLEKLGESGGWVQVKTASGATGWVHASAIETPRFQLQAQNTDLKTKATANEVALAGKGFNKQVEDSYRAKHAEVSFAWVDRMLQIKVAMNEVADFLKQGRLGDFGGGK